LLAQMFDLIDGNRCFLAAAGSGAWARGGAAGLLCWTGQTRVTSWLDKGGLRPQLPNIRRFC